MDISFWSGILWNVRYICTSLSLGYILAKMQSLAFTDFNRREEKGFKLEWYPFNYGKEDASHSLSLPPQPHLSVHRVHLQTEGSTCLLYSLSALSPSSHPSPILALAKVKAPPSLTSWCCYPFTLYKTTFFSTQPVINYSTWATVISDGQYWGVILGTFYLFCDFKSTTVPVLPYYKKAKYISHINNHSQISK